MNVILSAAVKNVLKSTLMGHFDVAKEQVKRPVQKMNAQLTAAVENV